MIDRFLDKLLDEGFTPCVQHASAEPSSESTNAGKTDAFDFDNGAIEHLNTSGVHDTPNQLHLAGFKVVIPDYGEYWNTNGRANICDEFFCFLSQTVIGQVAAEQQDVSVA